MLRVGLTGGIGSGKSAVAERLAALGAVVLDGDKAARAVVEPGTPGLAKIAVHEADCPNLHESASSRAPLPMMRIRMVVPTTPTPPLPAALT